MLENNATKVEDLVGSLITVNGVTGNVSCVFTTKMLIDDSYHIDIEDITHVNNNIVHVTELDGFTVVVECETKFFRLMSASEEVGVIKVIATNKHLECIPSYWSLHCDNSGANVQSFILHLQDDAFFNEELAKVVEKISLESIFH